jgi:hypothetical protein
MDSMQAVDASADLLSKAAHKVVGKEIYVERLPDKAVPSFQVVVAAVVRFAGNPSERATPGDLQKLRSTSHCLQSPELRMQFFRQQNSSGAKLLRVEVRGEVFTDPLTVKSKQQAAPLQSL